MTAILRRVLVIFAVVIAILCAVMIALGVRSPSIHGDALPKEIMAGKPLSITIAIRDRGSDELELESDSDELVITSGDAFTIKWANPTPNKHEHNIKLVQVAAENRKVIDTYVWRVTAKADEPVIEDVPPVEESSEIEEPIAEVEEPPAEIEPIAEVEAPPAEIEEPPAEIEPIAEVVEPPAEIEEPPAEIEPIAEVEEPPAEIEPVAEIEEPPPVEVTPEPVAQLPAVGKLADEVKASITPQVKLYGQGVSTAGPVIKAYIAHKLQSIDFRYDCPKESGLAAAHINALLAIGGEYASNSDPLAVKLNTYGRDALKARGKDGLRISPDAWSIVLRTTRQVGGVINAGSVTWRLNRYEPDVGNYAVVIHKADIDAK